MNLRMPLPVLAYLGGALLWTGCGVDLDCEAIGAVQRGDQCVDADAGSGDGPSSEGGPLDEGGTRGPAPRDAASGADANLDGEDGGTPGDADAETMLADMDMDGVGDDEDNCPDDANPDQQDSDGDGLGDACDPDDDGDAIPDGDDLCPLDPDPEQLDLDGDGVGDVCDDDIDGDGFANAEDACPAGQASGPDLDDDGCTDDEDPDVDGDGRPNLGDPCPLLAEGSSEVDGDGCPPSHDACPLGFADGPDADSDGCKDSEDLQPDSPAEAPARVYVDASQLDQTATGRTWSTAYPHLSDALAQADLLRSEGAERVQVWVAAGTYYPDDGSVYGQGDREASFVVRGGVELIGGFRFDDDAGAWRRDAMDATVLSGDLAQDDPSGAGLAFENLISRGDENACHVVTVVPSEDAPVVDGFAITGGNATSGGTVGCDATFGGGIFAPGSAEREGGSATFRNLEVSGNHADLLGGGATVVDLNATWVHCTFRENESGTSGGGLVIIQADEGASEVYGCRFLGNVAVRSGGLHLVGGLMHAVANSEFLGNSTSEGASALSSANATTFVRHCALGGNGPGESVQVTSGALLVAGSVLWNNTSDPEPSSGGSANLGYSNTLVSNETGGITVPYSPSTWSPFASPPNPALAPFSDGDLSLDPDSAYTVDASPDWSCTNTLEATIVPGLGRLCNSQRDMRFDITGAPRQVGDAADLGARETQQD